MKQFDYKVLLLNKQKKLKNFFVLFLVCVVLYASLFLTGILVLTYENKCMIMVIFSIFLSIFACLLVIFYVFGIIENKKEIKTIIDILNGYLFTSRGTVSEITEKCITVKNRKIIEITLTENKDNYIFYYDIEFGECPIKLGDNLEVKTSNAFLISYEVKNEKAA